MLCENSIILQIELNPYFFQNLDYSYRDNEKIAKVALQKQGMNLMFLSSRLKKNKDLVMIACQNNLRNIIFADKSTHG